MKPSKSLFIVMAGLVPGCISAPEPDEHPAGAAVESAAIAAPEAISDRAGHRWIRREPITAFAPESDAEIKDARKEDIQSLTDEQLADRIRPITLYQGYEYEAEVDTLPLARAMKSGALERTETEGRASHRVGPVEEAAGELSPQFVFGSDNRELRRDNTSYPMRTQLRIGNGGVTGGGSGTMIGASTAVSAAHVFVSNETGAWKSVRTWAPGMDGQDADVSPFGQWTGCYWVTVPKGYRQTQSFTYDFAVIEFSDMYPACNLKPGNTVGWLGWWHASSSTTESDSTRAFIYGYPVNKGTYPQIWGMGQKGGLDVDGTDEIEYDVIDTSGGQSGSGLYIYKNGDADERRVIGVHTGSITNPWTDNRSRRIDGLFKEFIVSYTAL